MPLKTKSVQAKLDKSDGIRVCIMRRPEAGVKWDIWMPHLAPSHQLLSDYHNKVINWREYCGRFKVEVLQKDREYLDILIDMSQKHTVTILCWEVIPDKCHRRLVAEECKKICKDLEVVIV